MNRSTTSASTRDVFVTGGTGYIGRRLIEALLARGHRVRALTRGSSHARVPQEATAVVGDALDANTYAASIRPADVFVHLIGTSHPNPSKAAEFQRVDLGSVLAATSAARTAGIAHFVYVSVAQPAPVMKAYIDARAAAERAIADAHFTATILRPWYVLGPGHWWPVLLIPGYLLGELIPPTRETSRRLGLVTIGQMVRALVHAVENQPSPGTTRVVDVPAIRAGRD
jgi:nucleoside-diphosphate-sugar epimerase